MKALVERIMKRNNNNYKIKTVLAYGAYDGNKNFNYLNDKRIQPDIKVRKNSITSTKNNKRNRVKSQTTDLLKWKKKKDIDIDKWLKKLYFLV